LFASVGYDFCNVAEMRANDNYDIDNDGIVDIAKGDLYKDNSGSGLAFDFSGLLLNAGIQFAF
jgi:hypothetical protein